MIHALFDNFEKRWRAYLAYRVGKGKEWRYTQGSEADGTLSEEDAAIMADRWDGLACEEKTLLLLHHG
jgi:hypothetical protein